MEQPYVYRYKYKATLHENIRHKLKITILHNAHIKVKPWLYVFHLSLKASSAIVTLISSFVDVLLAYLLKVVKSTLSNEDTIECALKNAVPIWCILCSCFHY